MATLEDQLESLTTLNIKDSDNIEKSLDILFAKELKFYNFLKDEMNCEDVQLTQDINIHVTSTKEEFRIFFNRCKEDEKCDEFELDKLLYLSVRYVMPLITRKLILCGATCSYEQGCRAYHLAVELESIDCLKALAEPFVDSEKYFRVGKLKGQDRPPKLDLDARTWTGTTCLHLATFKSNVYLMQWLLMNGANPNTKQEYRGDTPLHSAIRLESMNALEVLAKWNGAKPINLNLRNGEGDSPIHVATKIKNLDALKLLIFLGANVNIIADIDNRTPLHIAACEGLLEEAKLIANFPACDFQNRAFDNDTPLETAVKYQHKKVAKVIAEAMEKRKLRLLAKVDQLVVAAKNMNVSDLKDDSPTEARKRLQEEYEKENIL